MVFTKTGPELTFTKTREKKENKMTSLVLRLGSIQ